MSKIVLREIPKNNISSCNSCSARNYQGSFAFLDDKIVDKIYELRIDIMRIFLCEDCLKTLYKTVGDSLVDH